METPNKLGIQQRIPLHILGIALEDYLHERFDETYIKELLQSEYAGANRQNKALGQIKSVITKNQLTPFLSNNKKSLLIALNNKTDRNIILTALICGRYPFCYNVLTTIGKLFRMQDLVSSDLIQRQVGLKYGNNKSCKNSLYCAIPQMIETNMFSRPKPSAYEISEPQMITHKVTWKIWKECFYVNNPIYNRDDTESLSFEPFFRFIKN